MRDISKIRERSTKQQNPQRPTIKPREEKHSVSLLRKEEIRDDAGAQLILDKQKIKNSIDKTIKKKKDELEILTLKIEELKINSTEEVARIIHDAEQQANSLLTEARVDRDLAKNFLSNNKLHKNELDELDSNLTKRENQARIQAKELSEKSDAIRQESIESHKLHIKCVQEKEQSAQFLLTAVALLEASVEQLKQLQSLKDTVKSEITQTYEKTGIMIKRTVVLLKEVDSKNELVNKKAIELQNEKIALVDREEMLERSIKEVNNGR